MILHTSASAKIILLGEHAVVYGQPAIAVPVSSLRAVAVLRPSPKPNSEFKFSLLDLMRSDNPSEVKASLEAFAVIARTLSVRVDLPLPAAEIGLHSDIPIASGLGSGAAVAGALAKSLLFYQGHVLDEGVVNEAVYEAEKIHHGTPSGIDNSVIVYERPVYFRRDHPIEPLTIASPFTLLIADTGRKASTHDAVADVRRLHEAEPQKTQGLFDAIGELVLKAREVIKTGKPEALGSLMTENQRLLEQLTISSSELDQLVTAALNAGALGAKLSGGGRGGNMIALVNPDQVAKVQDGLLQAGAVRVIQTTVL